MGTLPRSGWGTSLVEDTAPTPHLRSEYPYPNGFLQVLLLTIHLLPYEPSGFANGFGEWLENSRLVRLLSVVTPSLGLPFLPCGFGTSVVPPVRGRVGPSP